MGPRNGHRSDATLEDVLQEEGHLEEARQVAARRVLAWPLQPAMESRHLNKAEMARQMQTRRSQLERKRLPDPDNDNKIKRVDDIPR